MLICNYVHDIPRAHALYCRSNESQQVLPCHSSKGSVLQHTQLSTQHAVVHSALVNLSERTCVCVSVCVCVCTHIYVFTIPKLTVMTQMRKHVTTPPASEKRERD